MIDHPPEQAPIGDLVRDAIEDGRQLLRAEILLAREEIKRDIDRAKAAGVLLGAAGALAIVGVALLLVALALAIHLGALSVLIVGAVVLAGGGAAGYMGYRALPTRPLGDTLKRLQTDVHALKERMS